MNLTWTGTDVLYCTKYPKQSKRIKYIYIFCLRIFARIADIFVQKHVVVSEHLLPEMKLMNLKKPITVQNNPVLHHRVYPKKEHKGFNVLYYRGIGSNQVFIDWLYGKDIIDEIRILLPEVTIIEVTGNSDMKEIYPVIDYYIRPNRHDGAPRMVRECQLNNIPYYHSYSNPNVKDIEAAIKSKT